MTQVEQIKAEIERLQAKTSIGLNEYDMGYENGRAKVCRLLLKFINSMQKEPVSENLNEVITKVKTKIAMCNGFNKKNREEVFALLDTIKMPKKEVSQDLEEMLPGTEQYAEQIAGRDYVPVDWVETLDEYGKWKIVQVEPASEEVILRRAIERYGYCAQINMALEKMGELIVALQHWLRGRVSYVEVCEEVADVQIIMESLAMIFDKDIVRKYYESKIKRLEQRLNKED